MAVTSGTVSIAPSRMAQNPEGGPLNMLLRFTRQVAWSVMVVLLSTIIVFAILRVLPGDPILAGLGASVTIDEATLDRMREEAGLNAPLVIQYLSWLGGVLTGDLGVSFISKQSVSTLVFTALPATVELTLCAVLLLVVIAAGLALWATYRPGSWADRIIGVTTSAGMAIPSFIIGIALIIIFSLTLHVLPARGYVPLLENPAENLRYMILPALTLALSAAPQMARFLRASMLDLWKADFVRTAEGKGASRWRVTTVHVLRNSLIPATTRLGLIVGYTLGGTVVIEYIFGIPGLGSLAMESAVRRDYALLQGVVIVIVVMFIVTTLIVDLLYGIADPRLRRGKTRG